jgi:hypothetical protein
MIGRRLSRGILTSSGGIEEKEILKQALNLWLRGQLIEKISVKSR